MVTSMSNGLKAGLVVLLFIGAGVVWWTGRESAADQDYGSKAVPAEQKAETKATRIAEEEKAKKEKKAPPPSRINENIG